MVTRLSLENYSIINNLATSDEESFSPQKDYATKSIFQPSCDTCKHLPVQSDRLVLHGDIFFLRKRVSILASFNASPPFSFTHSGEIFSLTRRVRNLRETSANKWENKWHRKVWSILRDLKRGCEVHEITVMIQFVCLDNLPLCENWGDKTLSWITDYLRLNFFETFIQHRCCTTKTIRVVQQAAKSFIDNLKTMISTSKSKGILAKNSLTRPKIAKKLNAKL